MIGLSFFSMAYNFMCIIAIMTNFVAKIYKNWKLLRLANIKTFFIEEI